MIAWRPGREPGLLIAAAAFACGLACASDGGLGASRVPSYTFPVREYTYPSGLRVVVEEDDTTPIAGAVLVVEAGSVDDPPAKAGLAHALEHLLFSAPSDTGRSLWNTLPQLSAHSFNAATGLERTTYFAFVPRTSLDDLVAALIGRMADPTRGIDEALLTRESQIIAEELRMRSRLTVRSRALTAILPPSDPYRGALAAHDQLGALTLADVSTFAEQRYRPERMTLVISGAIGPEWDQRLSALLPEALRSHASGRQSPVRRPRPTGGGAATPVADGPIPIVKAPVDAPELWLAWPLPGASALDEVRMSLMAGIADRVISERLERTEGGVLSASMWVETESQASAFICRARLRAPGDANRARDEITNLLPSLSLINMQGWGENAVPGGRRAVREATLRTALKMESLTSRAMIRAAIVHEGGGTRVSEVLEIIRNVNADDVASFTYRYLRQAFARSVLLVPDEGRAARAAGALRKASLAGSEGRDTAPDIEGEGQDDLNDGVHFPPGRDFGAARARVTTLANGLTIIALRRPGMPFVSMLLGFHGEPQPGEPPGIRVALPAARLWDLRPEAIDRGIYQQTFAEPDSYQEQLTMFSADTGEALDLIAEQPDHLHVYWPNAPFQRYVDRASRDETLPATRAWRAFGDALLGAHPYHLTPTTASLRALTSSNIQSWLERTRRPNNGTLVIVGDIDAEAVSRRAEQLLRDWRGDATPLPVPPAPPATVSAPGSSPRVLFTADDRRRSSEIRFGCVLSPIHTFAQDLRSGMLIDLVEADLRRGLRFKRGASYAPGVAAATLRGGTAVLEGTLDIEDGAVPVALELLRTWFDPAQPVPIQPADVERVRRKRALHSVFNNATNGVVAQRLFYAWNLGWPLKVWDDYPTELMRITAADLDADLKACRTHAVISVVGAAPPPAETAPAPSN